MLSPLTKVAGVKPEDLKKRLLGPRRRRFPASAGDGDGAGTLEQVTKAVAEVDAQGWCVIESVELKPAGKEAERFTVELGVAVPPDPDLLEKEPPGAVLAAQTPESSWAVQVIASRTRSRRGRRSRRCRRRW